jgi:hypothetical protein
MSSSYNPHFEQLLKDMLELHERKGHDYARDENPYSNFEEAAAEAGTDVNTVFKVMVGIKNARIRELERAGKSPKNEALLDSYMDGLMYRALQLSFLRKQSLDAAQCDLGGENYGHGV